jgi:hypothetical protein
MHCTALHCTHSPQNCKDIHFISLQDLDKHYTHHSVENGPKRATGKYFGSVIADNLVPLKDIFRYIPPLMHIIMGLGNNLFNELQRKVIELDKEETNDDQVHQAELKEKLKELYAEKDILSAKHANYNLDKMVALNDTDRIPLVLNIYIYFKDRTVYKSIPACPLGTSTISGGKARRQASLLPLRLLQALPPGEDIGEETNQVLITLQVAIFFSQVSIN